LACVLSSQALAYWLLLQRKQSLASERLFVMSFRIWKPMMSQFPSRLVAIVIVENSRYVCLHKYTASYRLKRLNNALA